MTGLLDWNVVRFVRQWTVRIETMWRGLPGFPRQVFMLFLKMVEAGVGFLLCFPPPTSALADIKAAAAFAIGLHGAISTVIDFFVLFTSVNAYRVYGGDIDIAARPEKGTTRFGHAVAFSALAPSPEETRGGFVVETDVLFDTDTFQRSSSFDDTLMQQARWPYALRQSRCWKLFRSDDAERRRQIEYLIPRLLSVKLPTVNERKCGFYLPDSGVFADIESYRVNYIDSLITNEAFRSGLHLVRGRREVSPRNNLTVNYPADTDGEGRAYLLPYNRCDDIGNHVGISVLGLTSDAHVVALRQGDVQIGAGTLNLGGSGSLNYADRKRCGQPDDFRAIVGFGMAREIFEEAGLRPSHYRAWRRSTAIRRLARDLVVTGYFRWVDRCGKPEFVGVVRLKVPLADIAARTQEVDRVEDSLPRVTSLADVVAVRDALKTQAAAKGTKVSTSSTVALNRLVEIAGYRDDADEGRRKIHDDLARKLFA